MSSRLFNAVAAIRYRQIEILLQCGVNVNSKNHEGKNVLMMACDLADHKKRYKMFRYLIQKGADEFETSHDGVSVFQYACKTGRKKIVKRMMKERGLHVVHLSCKDNNNRSALYHSVLSGDIDIVRLVTIAMRNQNIPIDQVDTEGNTPLIMAYKLKFPKIAELLMDEGKANPRICDRQRHLSATEWAEVCQNELEEERLKKTEKHRERRMIFPRLDHVVFRRKQAKKRQLAAYSLPMVDESNMNSTSRYDNYSGVNIHGRMYPHIGKTTSWSDNHGQTQTSESSVYTHVTRGNQTQQSSIRGKSIDSAMELLELASRGGGKRHYATEFVGSELDTTKVLANGGIITSMMDTYSVQNSQSFRKTVKPQPKPVPHVPPPKETKKRVSTLAIIMSRGGRSGSRATRKGSRSSIKVSQNQNRPSSRQRKHSKHRLPKQPSASNEPIVRDDKPATESDDVTTRHSLEQIPEEERTSRKRHSKNPSHKDHQFPSIGMRLVTQGVR
ncbi:uncharacterized protein [Antedon mediterranea]|uniref:uncharacterized protein n=1 Tax=Antedon mediterranea TaxID=105859 RepID=UPI003AF8B1A6